MTDLKSRSQTVSRASIDDSSDSEDVDKVEIRRKSVIDGDKAPKQYAKALIEKPQFTVS